MINFIEYLKEKNEVIELKHAFRINGVVDVWKNKKTIYEKPKNIYHNIEDENERESLVIKLIQTHSASEPFKKTIKGNMTFQEFKNRVYNMKK